jgi:hypothetical protein
MAGRTRPTSEIAPLAVLRLAVWRLGRSFRLALAVGLGILVAVILILAAPLYSGLVSNVALQQAMRLQLPPKRQYRS